MEVRSRAPVPDRNGASVTPVTLLPLACNSSVPYQPCRTIVRRLSDRCSGPSARGSVGEQLTYAASWCDERRWQSSPYVVGTRATGARPRRYRTSVGVLRRRLTRARGQRQLAARSPESLPKRTPVATQQSHVQIGCSHLGGSLRRTDGSPGCRQDQVVVDWHSIPGRVAGRVGRILGTRPAAGVGKCPRAGCRRQPRTRALPLPESGDITLRICHRGFGLPSDRVFGSVPTSPPRFDNEESSMDRVDQLADAPDLSSPTAG